MSQVAEWGASLLAEVDPYEIGWYVESADEEVYGPVSRRTLADWLLEGTVTPDTLVRHCTQALSRPLADQPVLRDRLTFDRGGTGVDRLEEAWPRKTRDRLALAEGSAQCAWHDRPATLVCVRCHAPYCQKCQMKPAKRQFFFCRRCQASNYNRRILALIADTMLLTYVPMLGTVGVLAAMGSPEESAMILQLVNLGSVVLLLFRDSMFGGASPGKRMVGLRVVQTADGVSPLGYGQGIVRWLSQFIPLFNLYDVIVPYRDTRQRRMGDRWAGTRVVDSVKRLAQARDKVAQKLFTKGVQPPREVGMTMEQFAQLP